MAATNSKTKAAPIYTHEGALASRITPIQQLRRSVMVCMLFEDNFYEDGISIAQRIKELVHTCSMDDVAALAIEARTKMKLRHVPLLLARELARHPAIAKSPGIVANTIDEVIQRADELSEFLALYWKDNPKQPLSAQIKKGLARAFTKFNEYELAKYNRNKDVRLRDVLFLCHAKPADVPADAPKWNKAARADYARAIKEEGDAGVFRTFKVVRPEGFTPGELLQGKLVYDQLDTPETWEVQLSAGADKKATFENLMAENKLGDLAFLRNLRNMTQAGVPNALIQSYGDQRKWGRVLPFRFIAAARVVPQLEPMLEHWMLKCTATLPKLPGKTVLLVDVSGSMNALISNKSDLTRLDAAKALAILLREICEEVVVLRFNVSTTLVPPRRGFALGDAIGKPHGGTSLGQAVTQANTEKYDRLIVITDEQSTNRPGAPNGWGYVINIAAHRNGVGYGPWMHIDGWSEAVIDYIQEYERAK